MSLEAPIVRVFRGETWLTVYRSVAVGPGGDHLLSVKNATKIKSCLIEVNFEQIHTEKVVISFLIFESRKYEVVVVGQK